MSAAGVYVLTDGDWLISAELKSELLSTRIVYEVAPETSFQSKTGFRIYNVEASVGAANEGAAGTDPSITDQPEVYELDPNAFVANTLQYHVPVARLAPGV